MNFKKKNYVGGIFLDLQNDFDCVNHDILLNKLSFYGIIGGFFHLIKTYLQDRYQRVILNNNYFTSTSDWGQNNAWCSSVINTWPLAFPPIYKWLATLDK